MYLLFMIKARIRWCTCRVENILTLGKLVSLWFVSSSILFVFDISNLLSYIQISSYELARPIMGTIFLVKWFCRYFLPPSFPFFYYYLYFHCINGSGADPEILEGCVAGHQLQHSRGV